MKVFFDSSVSASLNFGGPASIFVPPGKISLWGLVTMMPLPTQNQFFNKIFTFINFIHLWGSATSQLWKKFKFQICYVTSELLAKKCSDFGTWLRKTWKIGKLPVTFATLNFQELYVINFYLKSSWFEMKILFLKKIITKKTRVKDKNAPLPCKIGLKSGM